MIKIRLYFIKVRKISSKKLSHDFWILIVEFDPVIIFNFILLQCSNCTYKADTDL